MIIPQRVENHDEMLDKGIAVRVIHLRRADRWWTGDVGVIVYVQPQNCGPTYVVECANENGKLVYVADFAADEIEPH